MTYQLGVDLGTTYTAAAVARSGRAEIARLGNRASAAPSVVFLREDESVLIGEAANRRAVTAPGRVAREFKRRVGDPTPLILGGTPYSAHALMAKLLRWVLDTVTEREGGPPDAVAVTYPANWGPYKRELLEQAVNLADLPSALAITEPEAAAVAYAATERVDPGDVIAVYDLGGGTFDACILRKTHEGFEIIGRPEGIEHLGGIDFDQAVFAHVDRSLDGAIGELDLSDPDTLLAVARLRQDCVEAKEALSSDTDTSIPVMLPSVRTEVRLTRGEFEAMIRPPIAETIEGLKRALRSASVEPGDLRAVLLVGGSSRIPLVAQMVSAELGRPAVVDADPKHVVALGAAMFANLAAPEPAPVEAPGSPESPPPPVETEPAESERVAVAEAEPAPMSEDTEGRAAAPPWSPPGGTPGRRGPSRRVLVGGAGVLVIAVAAFLLLGHSAKSPSGTGRSPSSPPLHPASGSLLDWRAVSSPALAGPGDQEIHAIAGLAHGFHGLFYVAGGVDARAGDPDGAVWISTDGTSWQEDAAPSLGGSGEQSINGITVSGSGLLVAGSDAATGSMDAAVWASPDGRTWGRIRSAALGGPGDQQINRIIGTPVGVVAVGSSETGGDKDAAVWLSTDHGATWERSPDPTGALGGPGDQSIARVVPLPSGELVAVGSDSSSGQSDGAAWVSSDAKTWRRVSDPALGGAGNQAITDAAAGPDGIVASGTDDSNGDVNGVVWTSTDGTSWSRKVDPRGALGGTGDQVPLRIVYAKVGKSATPAIVVAGYDTSNGTRDAAVWISRDGGAFRREGGVSSFGGDGDQIVESIAAGGTRIVLVGQAAARGSAGSGLDAAVWVASTG